MFNWVVKVVPQPANAPGTLGEETRNAPPAPRAPPAPPAAPAPPAPAKAKPVKAQQEEASEDSSAQSGVLNWLSNGFASSLPQPTGSPRLSRSNSDVREGESSTVIGWITQGIEMVVPQPDSKYKAKDEETTEVYELKDLPDMEPLAHIPVVEVYSDDEDTETSVPQFPDVVEWIKHGLEKALPQPVMTLPPGFVEATIEATSVDTVLSPPPESIASGASQDSKSSNVVGWFVQGLGLRLPQPVQRPKDDAGGAADVLQAVPAQPKRKAQAPVDMILEDVDSDLEGQNQVRSKTAQPTLSSKSTQPEPEQQSQTSQAEQTLSLNVPEATTTPQEDAETQTGRWTPFIESIKREAEDVAMANMEERLLQERVEMVKMAEEVARQMAETTIRQMNNDSIRLSLQSQEMILEEEDLDGECQQCPAEGEPAEAPESVPVPEDSALSTVEPEPQEGLPTIEQEPQKELPTIEQEPQKELPTIEPEPPEELPTIEPEPPEELPTIEPEPQEGLLTIEPEPQKEPELQTVSQSPSPSPEPAKTAELDPEPATQDSKTEPEPVTQQPQRAEDTITPDTATKLSLQEEGDAEEGRCVHCGVPATCDAVKGCLMRIPRVPECLNSCSNLLKENNIAPPKLPSMPRIPTSLSQITRSLPPELAVITQELSEIPQRLTQLPQRFIQQFSSLPRFPSLPQLFPSLPRFPAFPQQFPSRPRFPSFPQKFPSIGIPQRLPSLPSLPQSLSQLPQRAQRCYLNVHNRLNSLKPQDA